MFCQLLAFAFTLHHFLVYASLILPHFPILIRLPAFPFPVLCIGSELSTRVSGLATVGGGTFSFEGGLALEGGGGLQLRADGLALAEGVQGTVRWPRG